MEQPQKRHHLCGTKAKDQKIIPMSGYILAGGQSKRMGTNKALINFRGISMVEHLAMRMNQAGCTKVFVVGKRTLPIDLPHVLEESPYHHPLYGVARALAHCTQEYCLVIPCDLPMVSITTLKNIYSSQTYTTIAGQPLLGLFPKNQQEKALLYAKQGLSVNAFVEESSKIYIAPHELHNVNFPVDLKDIL